MQKSQYLRMILLAIWIPVLTLAANTTSELNQAISWMYDNWITQYSDANTFKATKNIRRDEAAKIFVLFTKSILSEYGKDSTEISSTTSCSSFTDVDKKNTMKEYITEACNLWAIKWSNGKFKPASNLTNAQAVAIVMRMMGGDLDEPKNNRSANYYKSANQLKLLEDIPLTNKKGSITRWSLAILLYRVDRFYKALSKAFWSTWSNSTWTIQKNLAATGTYDSKWIGTCIDLPNKLALCESYSCTYTKPFTKETMKREIVGLSWWKCVYKEDVIGEVDMTCQYTEAERTIASSYFAYRFWADTIKASTSSWTSQSSVSTTDTIDGKSYANVLEWCTFSDMNSK